MRTPCLVVSLILATAVELPAQSEAAGATLAAGAAGSTAVAIANGGAVTVGVPVTVVGPTIIPELPQVVLPVSHGDIRIINLSTRAEVSPGHSLVTGFAISGTEPRPVLVRAVGPGLAGFGVNGVLGAPRLELRATDGTLVAENNGWTAELAETFAAAGAFPFAPGSADSAVVAVLAPGTYTMQVADRPDGAGGVVLAEIYDLGDTTTDSRLVNVSSLTTVTSGTVSGFILAGDGARNFLVRGVGPGLGKFGVDGTLTDPKLTLFDTSGHWLDTNNDWSGALNTQGTTVTAGRSSPLENAARVDLASASSGAFPLSRFSGDAAFVISLTPGVYTVEVSGMPTVIQGTLIPPRLITGDGNVANTVAQAAATGAAQAVSTGAVTAQAAAMAAANLTVPIVTPARPGVALLEIYELP